MKKFFKMPVIKKSWKKPVIITCVAAIVLVGGYFGYTFITKPASKAAQSYMKLKATKGNIEVAVSASGTAGSSVSKDILAQTNVTLGSFSVKAGDVVKSGQSIGSLVDANSDQNVQKAKNVLAQDNLKLAQLKKSLNSLYVKAPVSGIVQSVNASVGDDAGTNAKNLHSVIIAYTSSDGKQQLVNVDAQSGTISSVYAVVGATVNKGDNLFQLSPEDINNSITSQNLNISQDETALSNAQKQADYNNLLSPVNGTVAALNFNPGDNIQSGKAVATIIDLSQMQTVVSVDELDIDKVKVGQKATVTVDAITSKTFVGQVTKISSIGKTTNSVTTYDVTVSIDAADSVKTGMTTNVKISVQIKENVVMIPIEAVQGTGNNKSVTVENSGSSSSTSSANSGSTTGNAAGNTTGNTSGSGFQRSKTQGGVTTAIATSGVTRKRIQVGIANQNFVEVTSGVNEGDTVLVAIVKSSTTSTTKATNPMGGVGGSGGGYTGSNGGGRSGN